MRRVDVELRERFGDLGAVAAKYRAPIIETVSDQFNWYERYYDDGHCPNGRDTNEVYTDGRKLVLSKEVLEKPSGYFGGGGRKEIRVTAATWAVDVQHGRYPNDWRWTRPGRIILWPGCDLVKMMSALPKFWEAD